MNVFVKNPGLSELDELCIQTIRFLSVEGVQKAKSGHPGMPMGMAPAAYILWNRHLKHNPFNPQWLNDSIVGFDDPARNIRLRVNMDR